MTSSRLEQITGLLNESREYVVNNPSREVQLIQAMQEYSDDDKRDILESALTLFRQFESVQHFTNRFNYAESGGIEAQSGNPRGVQKMCVHSDGVYEIDEQCVRSKTQPNNDIFLLLLLIQAMM